MTRVAAGRRSTARLTEIADEHGIQPFDIRTLPERANELNEVRMTEVPRTARMHHDEAVALERERLATAKTTRGVLPHRSRVTIRRFPNLRPWIRERVGVNYPEPPRPTCDCCHETELNGTLEWDAHSPNIARVAETCTERGRPQRQDSRIAPAARFGPIRIQPVTHTTYGQDVPGTGRVFLELAPQLGDEVVDGP